MIVALWILGGAASALVAMGTLPQFLPGFGADRTQASERLLAAGCLTAAAGLCASSFALGM